MGGMMPAAIGSLQAIQEERLRREKRQDQARSSTLQMLAKNYDIEAQDLAPMARHQRRAQMFTLENLAPQDKANLLKSSHSQALSEMQQNVMEGGAPAVEPTQAPAMGTLTGLGSVPTGEGTATVGEVPEATKTPPMPSVAQGRLDELQQERRTHPSMSFARREAIEKESAQMRLVEVNRLTQEEVSKRNKKRQLADIESLKGEISPEMYQRARVSAVAGPGVFSGMNPSMSAKTVSLRDPQGNVHLLEHSGRMGKFFQPGTQQEVPVTSDWEPVATQGADKLLMLNDGFGRAYVVNLSALDRGEPRNEAVTYVGAASPRHPTLPPGAMDAFMAGGMDIGQILGAVRSPWLQTDVLKVAGGGGVAPGGGGLSQPPGAPTEAPAGTPTGTVKASSGRNVRPIYGQLTPLADEAVRKMVPALNELLFLQKNLNKEPDSNNPVSNWARWAAYKAGWLTDENIADIARTSVQASGPYLSGRPALQLQELVMQHLPKPTDSITLAKSKLGKAIRALTMIQDATIQLGQKGLTSGQAKDRVAAIMAEASTLGGGGGGGSTMVMDPNGQPHWFDTPQAAEWFRKQIAGGR